MGWIKNMIFRLLRITPASERRIVIKEPLSFQANVLKNIIWYRGDSAELEQFFKQTAYYDTDKTRFWAAVPQRKMRKIHSGIVSMVIDRYKDIVMADMNGVDFGEEGQTPILDLWTEILKDNNNEFEKCLGKAITGVLTSGDGAIKISLDEKSRYPIISFYGADKVDYRYVNKRLDEILYYTEYEAGNKKYQLEETYGKGYVKYKLFDESGKEIAIDTIDQTKGLEDTVFDGDFIMGEQIMFFESNKWEGRGKALFDTKTEPLDSLDEVISQWLDAVRKGRVNRYIPEDLVPRNPDNGELIEPNDFDNDYIAIGSSNKEGATEKIEVSQADIRYEAYVSSYSSFLDMVLQGIISPATLGIDLKKTDNAQAQREKEKITMHTRNKIIDVLYVAIPNIVNKILMVTDLMYNHKPGEYEPVVKFGEYATPDFDTVVDTVGKAKNYGVMSIEKAIDEMYGDTLTEDEKAEEIKRIKEQQGITTMEEPQISKEVPPEDEPIIENTKLNGAQIGSLTNMIKMVKLGQLTRSEAINIVVATLGIPKESAESFIEDNLE